MVVPVLAPKVVAVLAPNALTVVALVLNKLVVPVAVVAMVGAALLRFKVALLNVTVALAMVVVPALGAPMFSCVLVPPPKFMVVVVALNKLTVV